LLNLPETVNVATLQPPAGAGNVVTVFVPGAAVKLAEPGALIIITPDPPAPLVIVPGALANAPPPPPPVLAVPAIPGVLDGPAAPAAPPPAPPVPGVPGLFNPPAPPPA
jgi:actin cytoskeleton-regulatory complex protein PAN1